MDKIFVDLEIIAANDGQVFEDALEQVEYKASQKYLQRIAKLFCDNQINETDYRVLLEEHRDYKDRVLEEVDDKYKGKIDFKKIYEINKSNEGMVDYIRKMSKTIETYLIFYYNTSREFIEKIHVCNEFFPDCQIIGINFYQDSYNQDFERERTNKALYIKRYLRLGSLENCMLIDKSSRSCNEWNELNGQAGLYRHSVNLKNNDSSSYSRIKK